MGESFYLDWALLAAAMSAGVVAGILSPKRWHIAIAVLALFVAVPTAAISALGSGLSEHRLSAGGRPVLQFSTFGLAGIFSLALLGFEARRRAALIRAIDQEREVNRRVRDGVSDGIIMVDLDWRVMEWNPAMERLTGLTRRTVHGALITEIPGFDRSNHEECLHWASQGIEVASESIPGKEGRDHSPFCGYYSPLRDQTGEISGVFAIIKGDGAQGSSEALRPRSALEAQAA